MNKVENIVYFDNAATTFPKPKEVYDFMDKYYRQNGVNLGRGQYKLALKGNSLLEETRELLLQLFKCSNKKVVFTHTATEGLNLVLRGLNIKEGANVYISPFEHNAVTRVLHSLKKEKNINIISLKCNKNNFNYDFKEIKEQFKRKKPHIVAVNHVSNVCGFISPIKEIFTLAKEYNAITLSDISQSAGLIELDYSSDIYDFIVFAGHKTLYGPFGVAGVVSDFKNNLKPLIYGGTGIDSENQEMPSSIPEKYEAGSLNLLSIAGLNASLKWILKKGINTIYKKEEENKEKLINVLSDFENIKIIGDTKNSVGLISTVFRGLSSDEVGKLLNNKGIAVRTGLHCSPYAHKFLGTLPKGTVRFSVSYFQKENDYIILKRALNYIKENL